MGWTSLLGPAVVAAVVSGAVTIVGYIVSNRTARGLHTDRLTADRELAERKIAADITLAERKFRYDQDLDAWKRLTSLAEEVLADFYKARTSLKLGHH